MVFQMRIGRDFKNAEYIFSSNENRTFEGRFPVGQNGFWHSGIHVRSEKIYPMLDGHLVAYRIADEYAEVDRPSSIFQSEWEALREFERYFYEPDRRCRVRRNTYSLRNQNPPPRERFTNGFFLVRHNLRTNIMGRDRTPKELEFFTLYTNIAPALERPEGFQSLEQAREQDAEIAFYEKLQFRVATPQRRPDYIEIKGQRIFDRSLCEFRFDDEGYRICRFHGSAEEIRLPLASINNSDVDNPVYETCNAGVRIYDINMTEAHVDTGEMDNHAIAVLRVGARFRRSIQIRFQGFARVLVCQDTEIEEFLPGRERIEIPAGSTRYVEFLVRIRDLNLVTYGRGRFDMGEFNRSERDGIQYSRGTFNGMLIRDAANNQANVLGGLEVGEDVPFESPHDFWQNYNGNVQFAVLHSEDNSRSYLRIDSSGGDSLQVSITRDTRYRFGETVITSNNGQDLGLFTQDTLLGEPLAQLTTNGQPARNGQFYDLVLLLNDVSALEKNSPFGLYGHFAVLEPENSDSPETFWQQVQTVLRLLPPAKLLIPGELVRMVLERALNAATAENESAEEKAIKRVVVTRHPMEWDKSLYLDANGNIRPDIRRDFGITNRERERAFIKHVSTIDIWSSLQGQSIAGLDLQENSFWFSHPAYFASVLYKSGILDMTFNPYEGYPFLEFQAVENTPELEDFLPLRSRTVTVTCNPGFAPTVKTSDVAIHRKRIKGHLFSSLFTSPFGVGRRGSTNVHSGIDLATERRRTPIIALVHGVVWAYPANESSDFGKVMIIRGTGANNDKLYLLAHLHETPLPINTPVKPGDEVAKTGNTGTAGGREGTDAQIHLHLEVYTGIAATANIRDVLNMVNIGDRSKRHRDWWNIRQPHTTVDDFYRAHRVDPFIHDYRWRW